MKKIMILLTTIVLIIGLSACGKEKESDPISQNTNLISQEAVRVDTNLWYSDIIEVNNKKTYVYVIEVNSPDCFATPQEQDILYGDYAKNTPETQLMNKAGVTIKKYCTNEEIGPGCETFFRIESSEILDLKKISVFFKGSKMYENGMVITTEADYKEKYDANNWFALFSKLNIDVVTTYDTLQQATHSQDEAIYILYDGSELKDLYYWNTTDSVINEDENTVWLSLNLECITAGDIEKFYKNISRQIFMPYYGDDVTEQEKIDYQHYDESSSDFDVVFKEIDDDIQIGLVFKDNVEKKVPTGLYFITAAGYEYTFAFH